MRKYTLTPFALIAALTACGTAPIAPAPVFPVMGQSDPDTKTATVDFWNDSGREILLTLEKSDGEKLVSKVRIAEDSSISIPDVEIINIRVMVTSINPRGSAEMIFADDINGDIFSIIVDQDLHISADWVGGEK